MTAMRDVASNGSTRANDAPTCLVCGQPRSNPRGLYCSAACRQHAFRLRHAALPAVDHGHLRTELRRRSMLQAHTNYECSSCGEQLLGERRCPDCHVFTRAVGLGGRCPDCDAPILLADLLDLEGGL
jgi:ribosomal protein L32